MLRPPKPTQMTQAELARELKVSPQAVSDWLRGDTVPKPEIRAKIESLLGVPSGLWTIELPDADAAKKPPTEAA